MSLAMRLLGLFGLFVALTVGAGGAVMIGNAREAVEAEMRSALELGVALAREALPGDAQALGALGLRHLRFQRAEEGSTPPVPAAGWTTPGWFVALIGGEPRERRVETAGGPLLVVAEPWDEIAEVWEDMSDLAVTVLTLAALLLAVAALALRHALRPLARFEAAVERLRAGTYDVRFDGRDGGVPELRRLGAGIAALAVGLDAAEAENRRLGRRLVSAQDDERRELAREIHDELGAALFGIKVDAGRIVRLAESGETAERARSILDTAEGVHRLSRRILTRLRPAPLDQLPLGEALAALVGEWSRRQPAVVWRLDLDETLDEEAGGLDEALRLTVYRLVQESLVNALRHARPATVAVSVRRGADGVAVRVADDGPGLRVVADAENGEDGGGFGISGMTERVRALGGRLTVGTAAESGMAGGTELRAWLPPRAPSPDGRPERRPERHVEERAS